MDRRLEHNSMKRALTPDDIQTAHAVDRLRSSNRLKAPTSFKVTLAVWRKPITEVYGTLGCFMTAMPPCRWATCTRMRRAMAD